MIALEPGTIIQWLYAFMWPFIRLLALFAVAPVLGESSIPMRMKVASAAVIALLVAPTLGAMTPFPDAWPLNLLRILREIAIGTGIGLTMRIAFAAVTTAGEFIGLQMGLSFASFFDPATGANTAVLSRIMNVMAMLLFVTLDGHLVLLGSLMESFRILPVNTALSADVSAWTVIFAWSGEIMASGMLLALPLIIILLTISLSMGILNRTAQQLSVFAVGFPISLFTGLLLLTIVLPQTAPFLSSLFDGSYRNIERLLRALAASG